MKELNKKEEKFMKSLEWYVLMYDFNADKLEHYNIFNNTNMWYRIPELIKDFVTYEDFKEELRSLLVYCFWSKREYELFIGDAFEDDLEKYEKVDIYSQVLPNLDILANYIIDKWNNKEIK